MKATNTSISVISIVSAWLILACPPIAHAEDLQAIFELALQNDPTIRAAVATRDSAYESVKISRGAFLPQINLRAGYSDTDYDNAPALSSAGGTTSYSAILSQSIYDYRNHASHSQNKNFVQQSDADFKLAQQNLIIRVSTQYFRVLGTLDNLDFSKAEMESNERQLEQIKQRFDVGLVAITDVHEAQARYDLSRSQFIEAENILDNEVEALRRITGRYHKHLSPLQKETPLDPPDPNDIEYWTNLALQQNPSLVSTRFFVEQAQDAVDIQRSGHHPTLDLSASYNHSDNDTAGEYDSTTVGVNFNMNFYAGGSISAGVRQAQQNLTRALENLEESSRATQESVRSAFLGVKSAISQVSALKQAVISSQSRLKATEAGFDVGTRTTVDVLNARSELFDSERLYARARYDYILQNMALKQAAGMLDTPDIATVNNLLQK
ncbi:MAG: TolC family outer membrane protein [Gammaproteobacteria bacterium]|nr:TolC family outer membrane protein [Gammaproteobacteria bacterium]